MKNYVLFFLIWVGMTYHFRAQAQPSSLNQVELKEGKVIYQIPHAYELMHIAFALTDTSYSLNGHSIYNELVDTSTVYYKEVMRYFKPFQSHPLVNALNEQLRKNPSRYLSNLQLAFNSRLVDGKIRKENKMPWIRRQAFLVRSVSRSLIEDFARVSSFDSFYTTHQSYYLETLHKISRFARVNEQKTWLEKHFPTRYGQYFLVFSPLMNSTHFTQRFQRKGERQCIMWVATPSENSKEPEAIQSGRYMSTIMTEIDHNYVNPASDLYKKRLNVLMGEDYRKNWVTPGYASNSYKSGYKVFNEYLTHSVYLLFTDEVVEKDVQSVLVDVKVSGMEKKRGFHQFGEFHQKVIQLKTASQPNSSLSDIYPALLDWISQKNQQKIGH